MYIPSVLASMVLFLSAVAQGADKAVVTTQAEVTGLNGVAGLWYDPELRGSAAQKD